MQHVSPGSTDCDDADPAVYPGAAEVCGDGIDSDGADLSPCPQSGEHSLTDAAASVAGRGGMVYLFDPILE